jgi:hypothetical protein
MGLREPSLQSREGRLNTEAKFSAIPGGTSPASLRLPRTTVLGYFQSSPFDKLRAGSSGLSVKAT